MLRKHLDLGMLCNSCIHVYLYNIDKTVHHVLDTSYNVSTLTPKIFFYKKKTVKVNKTLTIPLRKR